jgi:TolB-like protein
MHCGRGCRAQGREAGESGPPLPLPDKPAIAVLPFANMNGDPEQVYSMYSLLKSVTANNSGVSAKTAPDPCVIVTSPEHALA